MSFAVLAEFPLGTYRAHRGGALLDEVISPARLHAALLNAAATGPRAVEDGDGLVPCAADAAVLEWLEQHPPDGLVLPPRAVTAEQIDTYREDGLLFGAKGRLKLKKAGKLLPGAVVWSGPVGWSWNTEPSVAIRTALAGLCRDVAYLGMAESPVRLRVGEATATHDRNMASGFGAHGIPVPVPLPGRTAELAAAHAAATEQVPSVRQDAAGTDEKIRLAPVPGLCVRPAYYLRPPPEAVEQAVPAPWETVVCVPLDQDVPDELRVQAATSVHRGLIHRIDRELGMPVPPCVTGKYPRGLRRPANGVAIQFLAEDRASWHRGPNQAPVLAVLIPAGAEPGVVEMVEQALVGLRPILNRRPPRGKRPGLAEPVRVAGPPVRVPAVEFWGPPQPKALRWWETDPAAVPDLRPLRQNWSGPDTVAASVGLLWRDHLAVPGRGDARSRGLAERARACGVQVREVRMVPGDPGRFVHTAPKNVVLRPYRAVLGLGELAADTSLLALGQSRHFGAGLLIPRDEFPDETTETSSGS
ncbi:type I-U CRISPR-associated protein Csb2 [Saccharopolyspora sp. 6M]|uniref:type I-G CRISPR-associated protein Csb2 n=1 Tax=Saccharopolyspora sp. 6M TaxID=2877237 RepID=UPI001CD2E302|nr:type I-U CRISPR-associated protein Csb2 [Saccharopolyspora sp. 6M]MCA1228722.1 type I-U CRISPR-associated protein Cas5/Cas6 [Saccharopolyspora sp. 6M]